MRFHNLKKVTYFRNFIFGVEDSLVSTVGLLSGVAVAGVSRETIFITGLILILVEAISMAAGSFLSEHSAQEFESHSEVKAAGSIMPGIVMLFSYFISGFIPLLPYVYLKVNEALVVSIIFSIITLFILGLISAKLSRTNLISNALQMALVGGVAIGAGMLAGKLISNL